MPNANNYNYNVNNIINNAINNTIHKTNNNAINAINEINNTIWNQLIGFCDQCDIQIRIICLHCKSCERFIM